MKHRILVHESFGDGRFVYLDDMINLFASDVDKKIILNLLQQCRNIELPRNKLAKIEWEIKNPDGK